MAGRIMPSKRGRVASLPLIMLAAALFWQAAASIATAQETLRGVALVIGNGEYTHLDPLDNPPDDVRAVHALLDGLGFNSVPRTNRDAESLARDLEGFARDARGADVAILYYAGHGIEAGGENWLVPVDADTSSLKAAAERLIPVSDILARLRETVSVVIVLLDACRDSPFPPGATLVVDDSGEPLPVTAGGRSVSERGAGPTLTILKRSAGDVDNLGIVIGFSAGPGQVAEDGKPGENSPYAAALARHVPAMAGEEFGTVMRMVAEEVYLKTNGRQRPWVNESLRRLLYFGVKPAKPGGDEGDILHERRQLLVAIAALPAEERQIVQSISAKEGVPMDALFGMLKTLGAETPSEPERLDKVLREQSERLKAIIETRSIVESSDPEVERLSVLAEEALAQGALKTALRLRGQAKARVETLSATLDQTEKDIMKRRMEFARVYADAAETSALSFRFLEAAEDYEKAFEQVEKWDADAAFRYRIANAGALRDYARQKGGIPWFEKAIASYDTAISLRPRDRHSLDWASAVHDRAVATAEMGDAAANIDVMLSAAQFYRDALEVWERDEHPDQWAMAVHNLALLLCDIGDYGGIDYDRKCAQMLTVVLGAYDRASEPLDWALTQQNLGNAYNDIGERSNDEADLRKAVEHFELSIEVYSRGDELVGRARSNVGLGTALMLLGGLTSDVSYLHEALAAYKAAASVFSRDVHPQFWSVVRNNMGNAHGMIAALAGSSEDLLKAKTAYEDVLTETSLDRFPFDRGRTLYNLASTLSKLARATDDVNYSRQAARHFELAIEILTPEVGHQYHIWAYNNYANALFDIYSKTNSISDLRKLADVDRYRLSLYRKGSGAWAGVANDLGYFLTEIARLTDSSEPLPEAISLLVEALDLRTQAFSDPDERALTSGNLCYARVEFASRAKQEAETAEALKACDLASALDSDDETVKDLLARARRLALGGP